MYLAKVYVTYKESILDPKGEAVKNAVHQMGYSEIDSVRIGKYFELKVDSEDKQQVSEVVETISDKLLANVTMETFRYEIEEVE